VLASALLVWAQANTGSISGQIVSQSGGPVPNAAVTVTNINTNASLRVVAGADGSFTVVSVPPGTYRVTVDNPGFRTLIREDVQVVAATPARLELTLEPGAQGEVTRVHAESEASTAQTDSGEVSHPFPTKTVEDLPILDRNVEQIPELATGITPPEALVDPVFDPQRSRQYSVNGQGEIGAIYQNRRMDGLQNVEPYTGVTTRVPANQDIQAFNVITANPKPQYGWSGGSVEPYSTRTGTVGQIHGSLFEFNSFSWLMARNVFNTSPSPAPTYAFNQFGGTIGAPVIKDKLFFFGSYENDLMRGRNTQLFSVPTPAFRAGNFTAVPGTVLGGAIPAGSISPVASALLPFIPTPNLPGIANNYVTNLPFHDDVQRFDGRVDLRATEKTSAFARYGYTRGYALDASPINLIGTSPEGKTGAHNAALSLTHVFGVATTGEGRIGYQRYQDNVYAANNPIGLGIANLPTSALPSIAIAGLPPIGSFLGYPAFANSSTGLPLLGPSIGAPVGIDNTIEYATNWTHIHGRHTFTAGASIWQIRSDGFRSSPFSPAGEFVFSGTGPSAGIPFAGNSAGGFFPGAFGSFLTGTPSLVGVSNTLITPAERTRYYEGFVGDAIKLTSHFTIDLGVRYDVFAPPSVSRSGGAAIFDPFSNSLRIAGFGIDKLGGVRYDTDNIAPRIGFAFSPTTRTVIRGGYGISYFPPTLAFSSGYLNPISASAQTGIIGSATPAGTFSTLPTAIPFAAGTGGVITPAPNSTFAFGTTTPSTPYVQTYSLMVQQDLHAGALLSLAYVGSLGRSLPYSREFNAATGGVGLSGLPLLAPFGRTASTVYRDYGLTSNYNSLQANLRKTFGHYIALTGSYTYSKAMDHGSNPFVPLVRSTSAEYGPADFDRTHILTISHLIQIPIGAGSHHWNSGFVGEAIGGWQLNGILRWATGTPFSILAAPTIPGTPYAYANVAGSVGRDASGGFNTAAFAAAPAGFMGDAGRNLLRGPGFRNYDLSLFRIFSFRERAKFELRGEAYNLTNSPYFANPVNFVGASNFGAFVQTLGTNGSLGNLSGLGNRQIHLVARVTF